MLAQAAYGADRDNPFDAQAFERPDIGTHWYFGWRDAVSPPMAREKGHRNAFDLANGDDIAWISERRLNCNLFNLGHALHAVESTTADNANLGFRQTSSLRVKANCGL